MAKDWRRYSAVELRWLESMGHRRDPRRQGIYQSGTYRYGVDYHHPYDLDRQGSYTWSHSRRDPGPGPQYGYIPERRVRRRHSIYYTSSSSLHRHSNQAHPGCLCCHGNTIHSWYDDIPGPDPGLGQGCHSPCYPRVRGYLCCRGNQINEEGYYPSPRANPKWIYKNENTRIAESDHPRYITWSQQQEYARQLEQSKKGN